MKCQACGSPLFPPTLIADTEFRCDSCHAVVPTNFPTNFHEIVELKSGICPLCGVHNTSFRLADRKLLCRACGRGFRCAFDLPPVVSPDTPQSQQVHAESAPDQLIVSHIEQHSGSPVCPACKRVLPFLFMADAHSFNCTHCKQAISFDPPIDIPRIVVTDSGVCPSCSQEIFHFIREHGGWVCRKCGIRLPIVLAIQIVIDTYGTLVNGRKTVSNATQPPSEPPSEDKDPLGPASIEAAYKLLQRALGRTRNAHELSLALSVEYYLFANKRLGRLLKSDGGVSSPQMSFWLRLNQAIFADFDLSEVASQEGGSLAQLSALAQEATEAGIEDATAIIYAVIRALDVCASAPRASFDVAYSARLDCMKCSSKMSMRIYRVLHANSPAIHEVNLINVFECAICGYCARVPLPIAFVDDRHKKVICYLDASAADSYRQTGALAMADDIQKYTQRDQFAVEIIDDLDEFFALISAPDHEFAPVKSRIPPPEIGTYLGGLQMLGQAAFEYGDYQASARAYELAVEFDPNDPTHYFSLAAAYSALGRSDDALRMLDRAHSISDVDAGYIESTRQRKAVQQLSESEAASVLEAMKRYTPMPESRKRQFVETFARELELFLAKSPHNQQLAFILGTIYEELADTHEMIGAYLRTIAIQPEGSQMSQVTRGMLSMSANREQTVAYLKKQALTTVSH